MKHLIATTVACVCALGLFANTYYVTPEGEGSKDGSSWANAFGSIQAAIDAAGTEPSTVCLLEGDYPQSTELVIGTGLGISIVGGFIGSGDTRGGARSVLRREDAATCRILNITESTVYLDGLVVSNGNTTSGEYGLGVKAVSSDLAFTDCVFAKNGMDIRAMGTNCGGAIYASGGSLSVLRCTFDSNQLFRWIDNGFTYGGAIYTTGAAVTIRDSAFTNNLVYAAYMHHNGGAISLNGAGDAVISNCVFTGNSTQRKDENTTVRTGMGQGGTIYFNPGSAASRLRIVDCVIDGSYTRANGGNGGVLYAVGAKQVTSLERVVVRNSGVPADVVPAISHGEIHLASGTLAMTNVLYAGCASGDGLVVGGGALSAENCTFTAITNGYAIRSSGATAMPLGGCIFDAGLGAFRKDGGCDPVFANCLANGEDLPGLGNVNADPLFGDAVWFHPQSRAGRYTGGWFSGGAWTVDEADSPSIDAGDPSASVGDEPQPNRHCVNIGYDAGTAVASKSYLGEPAVPDSLATYLYPLADAASDAVTASGEFGLADGGSAALTLYWGATDGGTNPAGWANSEPLGTVADWTLVSYRISGLAGVTYIRLAADDGNSVAWSAAKSFVPTLPPTLEGVVISHVTRHTLRVKGVLTGDGGSETSVRFRYWTTDESAATVIDYNLGQRVLPGTVIEMNIDGLETDVAYHCALEAVNAAGVSGEPQEVRTMNSAPTIAYVTPEGAGVRDGSSWANAFAKLQEALDLCCCEGDVIRLKEGTYADLGYDDANDYSQCLVSGAPGLTVRGGYAGDGDAVTGVSTLMRDLAAENPERRIVHVENSTVSFENLVFTNGFNKTSGENGLGVKAVSSDLTFTDCVFAKNGMDSRAMGTNCGGAIYASGGSLSVLRCTFDSNQLSRQQDNGFTYGGAIYTTGAATTIRDSTFTNNMVYASYMHHNGGALSLNGTGDAVISNCTFTGNSTQRKDEGTFVRTGMGQGGSIYFNPVSAASRLRIVDCVFDGSYTFANGGNGGVLYAVGAKQVSSLERVLVRNSGVPTDVIPAISHGEIHLASGTLAMTNVLLACNSGADSVIVAGGTLDAVNCTVTGTKNGYGVQVKGGATTLLNTILWDNANGGAVAAGGTLSLAYCDSQDGADAERHVIASDPKLYAVGKPRAYHLRQGSPCVGVGDPSMWSADDLDLARNPRLRNSKVDLGCYSFNAPGFMLILQ